MKAQWMGEAIKKAKVETLQKRFEREEALYSAYRSSSEKMIDKIIADSKRRWEILEKRDYEDRTFNDICKVAPIVLAYVAWCILVGWWRFTIAS